jgi:hypothetical protein
MKPLQELTLLQRAILALGILACAILAFVLMSWLLNSEVEAQTQLEPELYQGIPIDSKLLHLDKIAIDEAYDDQVRHLFRIWLKGGITTNKEVTAGLKLARQAYNLAASQIAKREQQSLQDQHDKDHTPGGNP